MRAPTDRQRVEALLIPQMLAAMVMAGVNDTEHPDCIETQRLLAAASNEALRGLEPAKRAQIERRMVRAHLEAVGPFLKDGSRMDKLGMTQLYLLQAILEDDYLVLHEGSALSQALDLILPAISHAMEIERLDASARKQSRKMLQALQAMGYFPGVGRKLSFPSSAAAE